MLMPMDPLLEYAQRRQPEIIAFTRKMVECESPSGDAAALDKFAGLFTAEVRDIGRVKRMGPHMLMEFTLPGKRKAGQILALGHSDTVWRIGTLKTMPFRQEKGRLWGPGVLDMKAGLAFFVFAMRALRDLEIPVKRKVVLQINADEEVGSESSRALTEEAARRSIAVLVLEPGTGLQGKLKTARKGVGDYTVTVRGKAAHAGVDFESGASAILEMSRQIEKIAGFTRLSKGITVNPGVIRGGTRSNVIAEECSVEVDIRVPRLADERSLARQFTSLRPIDRRCTIQVNGGLNRPPMEPSPGTKKLFRMARSIATELGVTLEESSTGGGSDGNFTAALGIPTLDGLGAVGEGAHATHESLLVDRIADRTALLAHLVAGISV